MNWACAKSKCEQRRRYRQANPEGSKIRNRIISLRVYGLTLEDYDVLLETQGGLCAVCRRKCSVHEHLSVDHCHKTNIVRGLLCFMCNTALGKLEDDIERIEAAIEYLERAKRLAQTSR